MGQHRAGRKEGYRLVAGLALFAVFALSVVFQAVQGDDDADRASEETGETTPAAIERVPQTIVPGHLILREPKKRPRGPVMVKAGTGRVGSGLSLGAMRAVQAPVGPPVSGPITTSVANLPNRTSDAGFAESMRTLTVDVPDFLMLQEVSRRSIEGLRAMAPGYDAYRDPQVDGSLGGVQSMNNVVMWQTERWTLVDAGRVKLVDNDVGFYNNRAFTWDRYATWAMLQRRDGAIVSIVSTHMPTNPGKYPKQFGNPAMSRVERYARGMDTLVAMVRVLGAHGPVLVGGDMNSHASQGAWTAAGKMTAAGYQYVKDQGVMYLFFQGGVEPVAHRQVRVVSDHHAIITTLDMQEQGPTEG